MKGKKSIFLAAVLMPAMAFALSGAGNGSSSVRTQERNDDRIVGLAPGGLNEEINLETIRQKIKEKGAKWEAGETSISKLAKEEKQKRVADRSLKLAPDSTPIVEAPVMARAPRLDWRSNNGNYVTPVKNQGSCGSCWAFSTTATAESANLIQNNKTYSQDPLDLSEQVMVSCSGAGTCNGGSTGEASLFLMNYGLPNESCYGYTATDGNCAAACDNWQADTRKIGDYVGIVQDVASLKNALASYGPIAVVMNVYSDFYYYTRGVYSYTYGNFEGGHAVSLIGYDDATKSFLAKNSWGTGWGEAGYFRIAYTELGSVVNFASSNLAYNLVAPDNSAPSASIQSPADGATVSGTVNVSVNASDNIGVTKVELYANGQLAATDTEAPFDLAWNTYSSPNGSVALTAYAYDARNNRGISAPVTVNVANAPDTVFPVVNIASPLDGATVSGTVTLSASATDNAMVASMEAYIDNVKVATSDSDTISYSWVVKRTPTGAHQVRVMAKDSSGNSTTKYITIYYRR